MIAPSDHGSACARETGDLHKEKEIPRVILGRNQARDGFVKEASGRVDTQCCVKKGA